MRDDRLVPKSAYVKRGEANSAHPNPCDRKHHLLDTMP